MRHSSELNPIQSQTFASVVSRMIHKILILALGVSAQVPHWMRPAHSPSFDKIMTPFASLRSKMERAQQTSSRRLMAITSEECKAACPGAMELAQAMFKMMTAETTPPPDGMDPNVAMMMQMCDMVDTLVCVGTTPACQDEEPDPDDDPGAMKCLCACPDLVPAAASAEQGDVKAMCNDKSGTIDCATGNDSCASLMKEMPPKMMEVYCQMDSAGCMEKMNACKSQGDAWETECEVKAEVKANLEAEKAKCCPLGEEMVNCNTADCMKLAIAAMSYEKDKGPQELAKMENIREVCPDSGVPTKAEVDAVISGGSGDAADSTEGGAVDSAKGQAAVSVAAITASTIALVA